MKKIIFTISLFIGIFTANATPFITRWDLNQSGSGATQIKIQVATTGPVSYTWETVPLSANNGSGFFNNGTDTIFGLPTGAIIRLKIDSVNLNDFLSTTDAPRLLDVEQWGTIAWLSMYTKFVGCTHLNISATDIPNLSNVTNMSFMFQNCTILNSPSNINNWNMSNIKNTFNMFNGCHNFNQAIGNWNTGSDTDMHFMFQGAYSFNQPIGNWNTSNVKNMAYMFDHDSSFNQAIGNWNTSNVKFMVGMFRVCPVFNQAIGNWNLSSLNSNGMKYMFDNSGMDCINYSSTLHGWANNALTPNSITLGATNIHYGTNAVADRNILTSTKGWLITGDIANSTSCICVPTASSFSVSTCNFYNFNGQNITASGVYHDTLMNAYNCDSIITLNLTIHTPTSSTQTVTTCNSYNFNGQNITASGVYHDTLMNAYGCDSIITLNLTITNPNTNTSVNNATITAISTTGTYQWLHCPSYSPIVGATNQSYTATANGDYAVIVTENACSDTSNCVSITNLGIHTINNNLPFTISPNPTMGEITITSEQAGTFILYNILGQEVYRTAILGNNSKEIKTLPLLPNSIYGYIVVSKNGEKIVGKLELDK